jgi:hypothetical protein
MFPLFSHGKWNAFRPLNTQDQPDRASNGTAATKNIPWMPPTNTRISSLMSCLDQSFSIAMKCCLWTKEDQASHWTVSSNELTTISDAGSFQTNVVKIYNRSFPRKIKERVGKAVICPLEPGEVQFQLVSYTDVDITSSGKTNNRNRTKLWVA